VKAEIKIPNGFRRLRRGEPIKAGDHFLQHGRWIFLAGCVGQFRAGMDTEEGELYIRKIAPRAGKDAK